jgi:DNA mismatch repair protein MutS2
MDTDILKTLEFHVVREVLTGYCSSPLGQTVASRLEPAGSLSEALRTSRQISEIKLFMDKGRRLEIQGVRDPVGLVEKALEMNRAVDPDGLSAVSGLLAASSKIRSSLRRDRDELDEIWKVVEEMDDLSDLEAELNRTVDRRGRILSSASDRLLSIRMKRETMTADARRQADAYLSDSSVARWLQERTVRIRNDRFVLPLRAECRRRIKGVAHGYSASGNTVFVEPEGLVEKQNQIERLRVRENREISRILWERTRTLIDFLEPLKRIQRAVGRLDFVCACAGYSIEYGLSAPELGDDPVLVLRDARHPILLKMAFEKAEGSAEERITEAFGAVVPLNMHLGKRFDILVITGPNTGGKTVALKTAGVLALMAASGLHIPAGAGSRVPVFSSVLADIGDEQDIFQSLSTFSSHIKRIGLILDRADGRSLVLLDELGSGTDPQEGEALGRAILAFLLARKVKVLASTHLSKLKEFAFSNDGVENGCMEFNPDTLRPTYTLRIGIPGESNAIRIARRLGVPESILADAEKALESRFEGIRELMDGIARARLRVEAELDRSAKDAVEIEALRERLSRMQEEAAARKAVLDEEAEREIDTVLREARDEALALIRKLESVPAPHRETVRRLEETLSALLERGSLAEKRQAFIDTLKQGDVVYIPRFREKCRVSRIRKKDRKIQVEYRSMAVDVPFDDVMWPHWF